MPDPTPQNTFVVRFWWDMGGTDSNAPQRWHGRIDHVQSGENIAFIDAREMLAFLERYVTPLQREAARDKEDA